MHCRPPRKIPRPLTGYRTPLMKRVPRRLVVVRVGSWATCFWRSTWGWADGGGPDEEQDAALESKRAFHAMRGKKDDDDAWDSEVKRAFHAMRGKRLLAPASVDSFIAQLRRAVLQGKRGSGFFGMRGKRQLRNGQKEFEDEVRRVTRSKVGLGTSLRPRRSSRRSPRPPATTRALFLNPRVPAPFQRTAAAVSRSRQSSTSAASDDAQQTRRPAAVQTSSPHAHCGTTAEDDIRDLEEAIVSQVEELGGLASASQRG
ncbi:hypothetical protein MRX96_029404 [Rhipicephalus microplus]